MKTLENRISQLSGVKVEITIISEKFFSIVFDGKNKEATRKIENFFKGQARTESDYDLECDQTAIYLHV